jgi:hypothetical protein
MPFSEPIIAGIVIAGIATLASGVGTVLYINRRRRRIRDRGSSSGKAIAPSAFNASGSHMHHSSEQTDGPTKRAQDNHGQCPNLGNGPGPTFVKKIENIMQGDSQSLTDRNDIPTVEAPVTSNTSAASSTKATMDTQSGKPVPDTMTKATCMGTTTPTAATVVDIKPQAENELTNRPSSLHQAVLDVSGGDAQNGGEGCIIMDGEGAAKSENSSILATTEVNTKPQGYTGAWP